MTFRGSLGDSSTGGKKERLGDVGPCHYQTSYTRRQSQQIKPSDCE